MNIQYKCYNKGILKQSLLVEKHPLYLENQVADGNASNSDTSTSEESIDDLMSRIKPMLEAVDLDNDITRDLAFNIAIGEIPGTKASDMNKRMLVLVDQNRITGEEYMRIAVYKAQL